VNKGRTPVLDCEETALLAVIDIDSLTSLRAWSLIGAMIYTFRPHF
jgi:hypothetical protein